MSKKKIAVETVTPDLSASVREALALCDAITLRLGRLASIAATVSTFISNSSLLDDDAKRWNGVEVLADVLVAELDGISTQVGELYHATAGGAR